MTTPIDWRARYEALAKEAAQACDLIDGGHGSITLDAQGERLRAALAAPEDVAETGRVAPRETFAQAAGRYGFDASTRNGHLFADIDSACSRCDAWTALDPCPGAPPAAREEPDLVHGGRDEEGCPVSATCPGCIRCGRIPPAAPAAPPADEPTIEEVRAQVIALDSSRHSVMVASLARALLRRMEREESGEWCSHDGGPHSLTFDDTAVSGVRCDKCKRERPSPFAESAPPTPAPDSLLRRCRVALADLIASHGDHDPPIAGPLDRADALLDDLDAALKAPDVEPAAEHGAKRTRTMTAERLADCRKYDAESGPLATQLTAYGDRRVLLAELDAVYAEADGARELVERLRTHCTSDVLVEVADAWLAARKP